MRVAGDSQMRRLSWFVGVPVVALLGGLVGGIAILHWGLVTPLFIVWPLAVGRGALLAAIGASWVGTLLTPTRTRSRLLWVVLVSEVTAVVLAVVFLVGSILVPLIFQLGFSAIVIALSASWATWRFRGPGEQMGRDAAMTLVLAMAVLVASLLSLWGYWSGIYGILASVVAVALSVILVRWRTRGPGDRMQRDAAVTLGLVGVPAPLFFGAYYLAYLFGLTSG